MTDGLPVQVFLDTNVYLSFYRFPKGDLDQLLNLVELIKKGRVRLYLPQMVREEFERNRESVIGDALRRLRELRLPPLPSIARETAITQQYQEAAKALNTAHARLLDVVDREAGCRELRADKLLGDVFQNSTLVPTSTDLVAAASLRLALGNPPGKDGDLGDRLNWECLLKAVPASVTIHVVTEDQDFASKLDRDAVHPVLKTEWETKKLGVLRFHPSLQNFLQSALPAIDLADARRVDSLVAELAACATFNQTHQVIARLSREPAFSSTQATDLILAAKENSQVAWIIGDSDIQQLLLRLWEMERSLDSETRAALRDLLTVPPAAGGSPDEETNLSRF